MTAAIVGSCVAPSFEAVLSILATKEECNCYILLATTCVDVVVAIVVWHGAWKTTEDPEDMLVSVSLLYWLGRC